MHFMKVVEKKAEIRGADIGQILIDAGKLTISDRNRILALQGKEEILFGEAAVALGVLTEEDVRWALSCQYSYPAVDADDRALARELIAAHDPADPRVEALRCIRSGLMFSGAGKRIKTIAVVSADVAEGKTFVAANLAVVFAQMGLSTLLMDLNFRTPRVHSLFQMKNNTGASSLIIKRALFEKAVHKTPINALAVLPSGPKPPNPSELLSWQDARELMGTVKENFDVAIVDTPAFVKTADAMMVAALCDGSLITALKGKTKLAAVAQMKKQLEASNVRILGSVMNEMGKKK